MKFGVILPNWEPFSYFPKLYAEVSCEAERLEYEWFFVTDHFMRPLATEALPPQSHATLEAYSILAHVAAKTSQIKLGTCVTPLPMRHPPILAKVVSTLDILSDGRMILGIGAGYDEREFRAYGVSSWDHPQARVRRTREALLIIKQLWTSDYVNFWGEFYTIEGAVLEPKPIQKPHPPIWSGGLSKSMLNMAAEFAESWVMSRILGGGPDEFKRRANYLMRTAMKFGRKPNFGLMGFLTQPRFQSNVPVISDIDHASEVLESYAEAGCEYAILGFLPVEKYLELMRKFKEEIAPSF